MANELTRVEFQSISGIPVVLDADTVINFCTRGNGEITPQEVAEVAKQNAERFLSIQF